MTNTTAPRFFEINDTRTLGDYAVSIWDKTNGDMLAYRVAPTAHQATMLGIELLHALVDSKNFDGVEVGMEVLRNSAY
jgi:hypothetical protein